MSQVLSENSIAGCTLCQEASAGVPGAAVLCCQLSLSGSASGRPQYHRTVCPPAPCLPVPFPVLGVVLHILDHLHPLFFCCSLGERCVQSGAGSLGGRTGTKASDQAFHSPSDGLRPSLPHECPGSAVVPHILGPFTLALTTCLTCYWGLSLAESKDKSLSQGDRKVTKTQAGWQAGTNSSQGTAQGRRCCQQPRGSGKDQPHRHPSWERCALLRQASPSGMLSVPRSGVGMG